MMRKAMTFLPHQRRNIEHNLYCPHCGNTHQWHIDVRLLHRIEIDDGSVMLKLDAMQSSRVLSAIERHLLRLLDKSHVRSRPIFRCANCHNIELDTMENNLDTCYNVGCPGCFHCGNWIDEDDLRRLCIECIEENNGIIDEDFCYQHCPHFDYGLEEVRQHYGIALQQLVGDAGY